MGYAFQIVTTERVPNPKFDIDNRETWINSSLISQKVETPHMVDNGLWTATAFNGGINKLLITGTSDYEMVTLEKFGHGEQVLFVSKQPFGVITDFRTYDREDCLAVTGHRLFMPARQIHKDELGRRVPVPSVRYAREAMADIDPQRRQRDNRRGRIGWALATDVAATMRLSLEQVLLGFWPFVDYNYDPFARRQAPTMDVHLGFTREQIHGRRSITPKRLTISQLEELVRDPAGGYRQAWIRRGYALTIMRLWVLGYQPMIQKSVPSPSFAR